MENSRMFGVYKRKKLTIIDEGNRVYIQISNIVVYIDKSTLKITFIKSPAERKGFEYLRDLVRYLKIYNSDGFLIHSCGVRGKYGGYLFAGSSEAGKTTMANLVPNRKFVLSDEEIVIKQDRGNFIIMPSHNRCITIQKCRLSKIFFIKKSTLNRIVSVSRIDALQRILRHSAWNFPACIDKRHQFLQCCTELVTKVPCYILEFLPTPAIWDDLNSEKFYTSSQ